MCIIVYKSLKVNYVTISYSYKSICNISKYSFEESP